jgi:hypothetical protein
MSPTRPAQELAMPDQAADSEEQLPGADEPVDGADAEHLGAEVSTHGSDEPTGSVKAPGTRKKGAGAGKTRGVRKPGSARSTKSRVARDGSGKSHAVTTKLDAELLRKLTAVRARSGMSESGLLRLALASYLDNLEQRSIAAEISKAAAAIAAASEVSMAPVVERLNTLEQRVHQQLGAVVAAINGIREALGEPVELDGLVSLNDAGESKGGKS